MAAFQMRAKAESYKYADPLADISRAVPNLGTNNITINAQSALKDKSLVFIGLQAFGKHFLRDTGRKSRSKICCLPLNK